MPFPYYFFLALAGWRTFSCGLFIGRCWVVSKCRQPFIVFFRFASSLKINNVDFDSMVPFSSQDEIVARIESRIAAWTFLPLGKLYKLFDVLSFIYLWNEACIISKLLFCSDNGEPIQILRYENGQKYEPHFDFFQDPGNIAIGGHRIATILMYLSNVEKGGETVFPNSPVLLFWNINRSHPGLFVIIDSLYCNY